MTQEFQWSRSLTKVLLETTPRYWPGLKPHLRAQFLFAQLWYALFSTAVLIGFSLPLLALALDHPWLAMNYPVFLAASLGLALVTCLPVWWLRACGCLRPINTPLISWEVVLFTIARAPWVLLGVSQGILSTLWPRPITFKVTPKGDHQDRSLPLASLLPYGLLAGLAIAAVLGLHRVSHTQGYYWLALVNAGFYVVATALILGLHRRENPEPGHSYRSHHILSLSLIGSFLLASGLRLPASLKTFSTQSLGPVTLAAAKPLIGSRIGGIPELIDEGRTGWLFPAGDVDALAALLRKVSEAPDVTLAAMGREGRARVERDFDRQGYIDAMLGLYADIGVRMPQPARSALTDRRAGSPAREGL
jgi:hypothetical protein